MGEEKNNFGNIELLPKKSSQLADWQFREIVVDKLNEQSAKINEIGTYLSDEKNELVNEKIDNDITDDVKNEDEENDVDGNEENDENSNGDEDK